MKKEKVGWENAIIKTLNEHNGVCTLKELYQKVPTFITFSQARDLPHNIRGYLRRLKNKDIIKQIGVSTYALKDCNSQKSFYEDIIDGDITEKEFLSISSDKIHGYIEGMLIEIGNMRGFDTYTPDKNVVFNGKNLLELTTYQKVPPFTYSDRTKKIEQIDVIWFKEGYPIKSFDVENSTDFTKALVRCYQLKYFRTKCFMIAENKKRNIFNDRVKTEPFDEIRENVNMVENITVFENYQSILKYTKSKNNSFLL